MGKCTERLYNGIVKENPTFVQMLGMCPTLAVTSSAINGAGMGLSTTCILVLSNAFISLLRKVIPDKVRIPSYIVIIASFVTVIQFLMQAYLPSLNDSLGIYIPLIVVNCIILGRAESYASKNKVLPSIFDGLGMGLGFTIGLTLIGMFRELIGKGCVFGFQIIGDGNLLQKTSGAGKAIGDVLAAYTPITIFVLAPGAFFVLAFIIATINKRNAKKAAKALANGEEILASCKPESCMGCANIMCAGRKAAMQDIQVNVQTNAGKASVAQTPAAPASQPKKVVIPDKIAKKPVEQENEQPAQQAQPEQSVPSAQQPVQEMQSAPTVQQTAAQSTMQPQMAASSESETTAPVSQEPQIQATQAVQPVQQPVQEKTASTVQQTPVQVAKEMSDRPRIHIPANLNRVPPAVVLSETDNLISESEKVEAVSEESDMVDTSKLVRPDVASADQVNKYQEFDEKTTDKRTDKKNKKRGGRK